MNPVTALLPVDLTSFLAQTSIVALTNWVTECDIPYLPEEEPDAQRRAVCKLDVIHPTDRVGLPVLINLHGGGLTGGSKKDVEDCTRLLDCVQVSVDYRLSPQTEAPGWFEDCAAACAWTFRNIERYGGDPNNVFLYGFSAGGYLTAMLAANPAYLQNAGCSTDDFRGFLALSGEMITHFHIREKRGLPKYAPTLDEYAPLTYVRPDFPPILLLTGGTGTEYDARPAENKLMHDQLVYAGCTNSVWVELPALTHGATPHAIEPYMRDFILSHLAR